MPPRGQSEPMGPLPLRRSMPPATPPMAKREGELVAEALHHIAEAIESPTYTIATKRG
jgi:hypothetical protein